MEDTATRATQHDDSEPQHTHAWGEIQHQAPPSYLVTFHGPAAIARMDWRYRACTTLGCSGLVFGQDVEHADVLAHLTADSRSGLDAPTTDAPQLTAAGATS